MPITTMAGYSYPDVGEIFVLPESEYRYGVGPVIARVVAVHGRGRFVAEPWWRITAMVANGTLNRHGWWVERELWIRELSFGETRKAPDILAIMSPPLVPTV